MRSDLGCSSLKCGCVFGGPVENRTYTGRELVFHGGMDNQQTLPFGQPEEVRAEVRDNLDAFRACKGYIVAPCHNIQPNTPTENIVALYRAVSEFG